ncbi:MAG: type II toxin-antitoxin system prevent-host-death family antitoxin [Micrococcales bacterium]|nr:type II toxin-antitoxin system prevent-host-death family antitoxin [Micrococcales bacterium]
MAQTVTVREVNQRTSAVFARVRDGEELIVTFSGQPQARIIPFRPQGAYERLVADGQIIPATSSGPMITRTFPGGADIDDVLAELRSDREVLT